MQTRKLPKNNGVVVELTATVGHSRKSTSWYPLMLTVSELYSRLESPCAGTETQAEYLAMSKAQG